MYITDCAKTFNMVSIMQNNIHKSYAVVVDFKYRSSHAIPVWGLVEWGSCGGGGVKVVWGYEEIWP